MFVRIVISFLSNVTTTLYKGEIKVNTNLSMKELSNEDLSNIDGGRNWFGVTGGVIICMGSSVAWLMARSRRAKAEAAAGMLGDVYTIIHNW